MANKKYYRPQVFAGKHG